MNQGAAGKAVNRTIAADKSACFQIACNPILIIIWTGVRNHCPSLKNHSVISKTGASNKFIIICSLNRMAASVSFPAGAKRICRIAILAPPPSKHYNTLNDTKGVYSERMSTMKVAIIGLAQSGKTTVFRSLCGCRPGETSGQQMHVANVKVPDDRLEYLAGIFKPSKVVHSDIDFMDIAAGRLDQKGAGLSPKVVTEIRSTDALVMVIRAFENPAVVHPLTTIDPIRDAGNVTAELILSDLIQVEKRIEKIEKEHSDGLEKELLLKMKQVLDEGRPLRLIRFTPAEQIIVTGFNFLSQKPLLLILNISESDINAHAFPEFDDLALANGYSLMRYCAEIEAEMSELDEEGQAGFLAELGLQRPGRERMITEVYRLLHLISFLTVGEDEVRAWSIPEGTSAVRAAGKVHTDMERGFIKAEVIQYEDFKRFGSMHAAKEAGFLRLEGKSYEVQDGDIISFRFHV